LTSRNARLWTDHLVPFRPCAAVDAVSASGTIAQVRDALSMQSAAAPPPGTRSAAFFDLDKTIIAGSSALAFRGPFRRQGLISRRAALRSGYAQLLLMLSGADANTMELLRRRITALCTGWEVAQIQAIVAETLHDIVEPLVYAEATELIAEHKANGDEVVVLSASGLEVVEPIAALVGADRCIATRMGVADGRYTGVIDYYCYGEEKARAAREIAAGRGYRLEDCRAYSDSITDLPLLDAVGHPTVVNPDRALRRVAEQRGWPILTFADPVVLRMRWRPSPVRTALTAAGLGAGAAVLALGWFLRRHPLPTLTAATGRAHEGGCGPS
jgi:HAD superfamily hydrolase (TIGR01490 family)